ncbi:unnamed protein product [Boreogadus saida]
MPGAGEMDDFDRNAIPRGILRRRRVHGSGNVWSVRAVWSTGPKPDPTGPLHHSSDRPLPTSCPGRTAPLVPRRAFACEDARVVLERRSAFSCFILEAAKRVVITGEG